MHATILTQTNATTPTLCDACEQNPPLITAEGQCIARYTYADFLIWQGYHSANLCRSHAVMACGEDAIEALHANAVKATVAA